MKIAAAYFRQKAEQCRRLAVSIRDRDDPSVAALECMADEFDRNAAAIEMRMTGEVSPQPCIKVVPSFH